MKSPCSLLFRSVVFLMLANGIYLIWSHRFFPSTDYPRSLFEGDLFYRWIHHQLAPHHRIVPYPVPYTTLLLMIAGLEFIFPLQIVGKVVLTCWSWPSRAVASS